jgi:hypothetical protein
VAKGGFILLAVVFASTLVHAQGLGEVSGGPQPDITAPLVGSALTCSQLPQRIVVPNTLVERAKVKARLLTLLRDSLSDDARGIVNIAREKEIRKLASRLK